MRGLGILAVGAAVLALSGIAAAESVRVQHPPIQTEFAFSPKALPKRTPAPAALVFEARLPTVTADGMTPVPAARTITLRLDRNIVFDFNRHPSCRADLKRNGVKQIEALCASAIVGRGIAEFDSAVASPRPEILLPETLVLNGGRRGAIRTLYLVKGIRVPPTTVVMPIRIRAVDDGRYGREAVISIPGGSAVPVGPLEFLELVIDKRFIRDGREVSVVSARCPDGKLMLSTEIEFADGTHLNEESVRPCTGRG